MVSRRNRESNREQMNRRTKVLCKRSRIAHSVHLLSGHLQSLGLLDRRDRIVFLVELGGLVERLCGRAVVMISIFVVVTFSVPFLEQIREIAPRRIEVVRFLVLLPHRSNRFSSSSFTVRLLMPGPKFRPCVTRFNYLKNRQFLHKNKIQILLYIALGTVCVRIAAAACCCKRRAARKIS